MIRVLFALLLLSFSAHGQDSTHSKNRLKGLVVGASAGYTASLIALNQLWYADFERQSFHFFNDNRQWKQIDKLGHAYSAFHISKATYKSLKWAGVEDKKSIIWAGITSAIILTPIEIFDGFSAEYGASTGDILANSFGGLLFVGQQRLWNEIRIHPKFSFRRTSFAPLRPETLGNNLSEELIKDYNGQTYWFSVDLSRFHKSIPRWLNIAVGYGAEGMIYANDRQNRENGYSPNRQFYLAIDPDLSEYKSKSKFLNTLYYIVTMVKIPAPTIEYANDKFTFHSFHY